MYKMERRPLAWEPPYASGAPLKRQKKKKEQRLGRVRNKDTHTHTHTHTRVFANEVNTQNKPELADLAGMAAVRNIPQAILHLYQKL